MEVVGYLAPIAFVFALAAPAALAQISALKKEVDRLKASCIN